MAKESKKKKKKSGESPSASDGGKELVLTEKPSVARDIISALGGKKSFETHDGYFEGERYLVSWAIGHLLEFINPEEIDPVYKRWRLADLPIFPDPFSLKPKSGQKSRLSLIKKLLNRSDVAAVINACDAGREGELIFREICQYLANEKPVRRLWLQSMTPQAILTGFEALQPGKKYEGLGSAAECRAESDWLIGINATRALTKRLQTRKERVPWSAGRVQTPTLALLVDRELQILVHRSKPYWRLKAVFSAPDHSYEGWWFRKDRKKAEGEEEVRDDWIMDPKEAQALLEKVTGKTGNAREERKPSKEKAPAPFDLTSLQREAHRRLGYSAKRTLQAAQQLYEKHKLITYPRTDSRCLPSDYEPKVQQVLSALAGTGDYADAASTLLQEGIQNRSRVFNDKGVSDHFAIMPTEMEAKKVGQDAGRVYDLVVRRFLAAFFPPALWENVERITTVEEEQFRTRARVLKKPGWQQVYEKKAEGEEKLPPLAGENVGVQTVEAEVVEEEVKPPQRISEAGLLKLMENAGKSIDDEELSDLMRDKGLGTPATRAEIIENLIGRAYVKRVGKSLAAAPKGIRLIDILRRIHVDRLASAALTGELEQHLRQLERGERSRDAFTSEIKEYTSQIVERAKAFEFGDLYKDEPPLGACPTCKQRQVIEEALLYKCQGEAEKACSFLLWKEKQGRYLDRETVEILLEQGKTPPLTGFFRRDGRPYSAYLQLDPEGQVHVQLAGREEQEGEGAPENPEALAPCPVCKEGEVFQSSLGYRCSRAENGCTFKFPAELCRREMKREEARAFITEGRTDVLGGFISKRGRPFRASLVLNPKGGIEWEFPPRGDEAGAGAVQTGEVTDPESLATCPMCQKGKVLTFEHAYACRVDESESGCGFMLPRVLLGRSVSREEATDYVSNGKTETLEGFISKRGRPFSAAIIRKKNGKHMYQFPTRKRAS